MPSFLTRLLHALRPPAAETIATQPAGSPATDFQSLAENSVDIILRVGRDARVRYASPSVLRILGYTPEEMMGKLPSDLYLPEDVPIIAAATKQIYDGSATITSTVGRIVCKDSSIKWIEARKQLLRGPANGPDDSVVILRDVTDVKLLELQLTALSLTDGLTSLSNRRAFDDALLREWKCTLRTGQPTSLLLVDVDHFKEFNDRYGHQVGDDCLRSVAVAVAGAVRRPRDFVARYGGEEIAVILPETNSDGALKVAEQVRAAIEDLCLPHLGNPEGKGRVTASVGLSTAVSSVGGTVKMPEGLLLTADGALYKAKHNGRNRVEASFLLTPAEPRRTLHLA